MRGKGHNPRLPTPIARGSSASLEGMRLRSFVAFGLGTLTLAVSFAGCGEDPPPSAESPSDGDGGDADGQTGPTPAPFGLDRRPTNATCVAPERPPSTASVRLERVFQGVNLSSAMAMAQLPGDGSRWYVAERGGRIVSFPNTASASGNPREDLTVAVDTRGEGGLLGMAFHPKFAENGRVYLSYTVRHATDARYLRSVVGYAASPSRAGASFGATTRILEFDQESANNHKGGGLGFGKDGFLYAAFGDGGGSGDPFRHGQETTTFFSKVLRLDVDRGSPYAIPPSNPFANDTGSNKKEIFAWGFRNPFRLSFDSASGDLWVGDVGQDKWEEIDKVRLGGNYGWPIKEGTHCHPSGAADCVRPGLEEPVWEYEHLPNRNSRSVTGGVVYRGKAMPALVGSYVFGDHITGRVFIHTVDPVSGRGSATEINADGPTSNWSAFAEDQDGEVYALGISGAIFKLVPNADAEVTSAFPATLSATGCVDRADPKKPAPGLVPFGVNSALWSDGADKERYFALPEGKTIAVGADGDWDMPVGTVLVKTFSIGGRRIETRLLVRHTDGEWGGYTYEWNDAQTDATLLLANKTKTVGAQSWYFPSRADCFTCHTSAAGRSLGLETGQLNGDFVYAETNRLSNQLATLDHIGVFAAPIGDPDQRVRFPDPEGSGDLEGRARAYLHANCSSCHRPDGAGRGGTDLRFGASFAATAMCDATPESDLGIDGAKILAPGAPEKSILTVRTGRRDAKQMPPLGTSMVDTVGSGLLTDWIRSIGGCPTSPDP